MMRHGAKKEAVQENMMYHFLSFILHSGQFFSPVFCIVMRGGNEMMAAKTHTTTIVHLILRGVLLRLYSMARETDQYLSRLMAHRCTMEEVQKSTSKAK